MTNFKRHLLMSAQSIFAGLVLVSCSSGGDSSSDSAPNITPPPQSTVVDNDPPVVNDPPPVVNDTPPIVADPPITPAPPVIATGPTAPRAINSAPNAPLASIDAATGRLAYGPYANEGQTNADNILPDFSHAGYMGGGVALPTYASIPVRITLSPTDSDADDLARVQAAIDSVSAMEPDERGIKGAVLLEAGTYNMSSELFIRSSGVILRGEGQGPDGTIINSTNRADGSDRYEVIFVGGESDDEETDEASDDRTVRVGDRISIRRTPNQTWLEEDGVDTAQFGWTISQYETTYDRTVTAIEGNTLFIDIPTVEVFEDQFGSGEVFRADVSGRITQVGIENLSIQSAFLTNTNDENRAFYSINFHDIEDSWIRDATSRVSSHGFNMQDGAVHNTIQNVSYLDPNFDRRGGRIYAFNFEGGQLNFFNRCYGDEGRHTLTSGSRALGPNVFLDCVIERSTDDDGPHQRWSTGTLFDNARGQLIRFQNRQTSGTGHGWAGAQQLVWNSEYDGIVVQAPPGAMNFSVGTIAGEGPAFFTGQPEGTFESEDGPVLPRSLYLQQLEERLGPDAVAAITLPEQREGRIWDLLDEWAGVGPLVPIE